MLQFTLETVSPNEASRILAEHDEAIANGEIINRPRKWAAVRRYQADLLADRWYPETGETLKFETLDQRLQGKNLLDGQNRLEACKRAERALTAYVARGVGRPAFSFIDGGVTRNLATKLHIVGESYSPNLAVALKWLCRWDDQEGRLTGVVVTDQAAIHLLESDPAIRKSVAKAMTVREQRLLSVSIATFLHRIFSKQDRPLADSFIEALATGAGLEAGDPFLVLRQKLTSNKGARKKFSTLDICAMSIRCWNARRSNREVKLLRGAKTVAEVPGIDLQRTVVQGGAA